MKIRRMRKADVRKASNIVGRAIHPRAGKIAQRDFRRGFDPAARKFYRLLRFWVCEEDGKILGVIGAAALHSAPRHVCWLDWFSVDPRRQGKGIGTSLLRQVEKAARKQGVSILAVEGYLPYGERGIRFYKKHGFRRSGLIKNYWLPGIHWVLMVKALGPFKNTQKQKRA